MKDILHLRLLSTYETPSATWKTNLSCHMKPDGGPYTMIPSPKKSQDKSTKFYSHCKLLSSCFPILWETFWPCNTHKKMIRKGGFLFFHNINKIHDNLCFTTILYCNAIISKMTSHNFLCSKYTKEN